MLAKTTVPLASKANLSTPQRRWIVLQDVPKHPPNQKRVRCKLSATNVSPVRRRSVTVELDLVGSAGFVNILRCGDLVTVVVNDG